MDMSGKGMLHILYFVTFIITCGSFGEIVIYKRAGLTPGWNYVTLISLLTSLNLNYPVDVLFPVFFAGSKRNRGLGMINT